MEKDLVPPEVSSARKKLEALAANVVYAYPPERQPVGTKPVYRFWSNSMGRHFYTMSETDKSKLEHQPKVWAFEGVAWNAFDKLTATSKAEWPGGEASGPRCGS
jgi:hypothetical protein